MRSARRSPSGCSGGRYPDVRSHAALIRRSFRAFKGLVTTLALSLILVVPVAAQVPDTSQSGSPNQPAATQPSGPVTTPAPVDQRPAETPAGAPTAAHLAPAEAGHAAARGAAVHHEEPLWKSGARVFNFALLAGTLIYFLRAPMKALFDGRIAAVRADLVRAADMRKAAGEQLDAVETRMRALPGELDALREKAARDIVAERARIQEAAETERQRLVAQAKSQAAQRVSGAERDLLAGAADHVIRAATARIRATITDTDQARLIERYLAQVAGAGRAAGAGERA
jgi:F0F1-type ATP synthase membrane subunit b/b'